MFLAFLKFLVCFLVASLVSSSGNSTGNLKSNTVKSGFSTMAKAEWDTWFNWNFVTFWCRRKNVNSVMTPSYPSTLKFWWSEETYINEMTDFDTSALVPLSQCLTLTFHHRLWLCICWGQSFLLPTVALEGKVLSNDASQKVAHMASTKCCVFPLPHSYKLQLAACMSMSV